MQNIYRLYAKQKALFISVYLLFIYSNKNKVKLFNFILKCLTLNLLFFIHSAIYFNNFLKK